MGSCISSNTKHSLCLYCRSAGTPIPSSLTLIQQFLACLAGSDSIGHRILRILPGSLGAVNTIHAQLAIFRYQSWQTWMLTKKAIPVVARSLRKFFSFPVMATLGFRESYQLLASVQARKAKECRKRNFVRRVKSCRRLF
jgi:hypothetical protein